MITMSAPSKTTLETLLQRATAGQKFNRHNLFRPSLSYYLLKDPFWLWCQHHAPKNAAVDETTRYEKLRMQQGVEYEQRWVKSHYPDAVEIKPGFGFAALKNTCRALLAGAPAIYQPQLWDLAQATYGKGDLLVRDDSAPSDLGPFHYRVIEIKRSQSLQTSHALQGAFYNENIGKLQGFVPDQFTIVLKDSEETVSFADKAQEIAAARELWRELRDGSVVPETNRPPNAASSPWRIYANQRASDERDLILLAESPSANGTSCAAPAFTESIKSGSCARKNWWRYSANTLARSPYHVSQAYKVSGPILKPGQQLTIPRSKRLLYFDFETSDSVHPSEPPHTYLIGCYDGARDQFVKFLARGAEDEARIFTEFFDYVGDPRDVCLYHWTDFEIQQMRRVARRWPMLSGIDRTDRRQVRRPERGDPNRRLSAGADFLDQIRRPGPGLSLAAKRHRRLPVDGLLLGLSRQHRSIRHRPRADLQRRRLPGDVACRSSAGTMVDIGKLD